MEWTSKILEILKLPTKFIIAIFIISFFLLFSPDTLLSKLHLKEFTNKYSFYLGISLLSSFVLIFIEVSIYIWNFFINLWNFFKRKKHKSEQKEKILNRLNSLDPFEQSVLREFFMQGKRTIKLPIDNPTITGLLTDNILTTVGILGKQSLVGVLFNCQLSNHINSDKLYSILKLPTEESTQEEINFLQKNRPPFVRSIQKDEEMFNLY